MGVSFVFNRPE